MMKKIFYSIIFAAVSLTSMTSCSDWLDVRPNNEQVTPEYWQSKEEVEAVLASTYFRLREAVPTLIKWGELRGGSMYTLGLSDSKLQDFSMISSNKLCDYSKLYQVIGYANSVLMYAPQVRSNDDTYYESVLNAHLAEAYFLRAYCYMVLLKNFSEVPLITQAYVDDSQTFNVAKATEEQIIAQIKSDVATALATGAAKGTYEEGWQTKGRATKWALYALGAEVSLWSEDYQACKDYCDMILNATDSFRPTFYTNTADWYEIFYPTKNEYSNEGIFELTWNYNSVENSDNNFSSLFDSSTSTLRLTERLKEALVDENQQVAATYAGERTGRMFLATYVGTDANNMYVWKYNGNENATTEAGGVRVHKDANFIVYRVAEIILMKAQAEAMQGNKAEAVALVNRIRLRAALPAIADTEIDQYTEQTLLEEILHQKEMEFVAEGKRWYDILWLSRVGGMKYRGLATSMIEAGNYTANKQMLHITLSENGAWYMPLPQADLEHNQLLVQNPYYKN